jgi:hypothetical protein
MEVFGDESPASREWAALTALNTDGLSNSARLPFLEMELTAHMMLAMPIFMWALV